MTMRSISLLFTWFLAGCAASTASQSAETEGQDQSLSALMEDNAAKDAEDFAGDEQCLDETNEPKNCERDSDCCEDFTCGWDPQISHVVKVCVYGGSDATAVATGSE